MQVAGLLCSICEEKLFLDSEGLGCGECGLGFCHSCLEDSVICPECESNMLEAKNLAEQEREEGDRLAERNKAFRIPFYPWILVFLIVGNIIRAGSQPQEFDNHVTTIGATAILVALLFDYMWTGVPFFMGHTKKKNRH